MVVARRAGRPLLLIDIAVPRDVDPRCGELAGVTLYDIDDLQAVVRATADARQREARGPRRSSRRRSTASRAGSGRSRRCRRSARCANRPPRWPSRSSPRTRAAGSPRRKRDLARVDAIARAVAKRLLHEPTIRLRSSGRARCTRSLALVRELFGLREDAGEARRESAAEDGATSETGLAEVRSLDARADAADAHRHAR